MGNASDKAGGTDGSGRQKHDTQNVERSRRFSDTFRRRLSRASSDDVRKGVLEDSTLRHQLSDEGKKLFAEGMLGDKNSDSSNTHNQQNEVSLSDFGAQILSNGLHAGNRVKIQEFCKTSSQTCADCFGGEAPRWCVISFGAFVCDDCAGAHRALPASVSGGVRSLFLDEWTDEAVDQIISKGGNSVINATLEYHVPAEVKKPQKGITKGEARREWVRMKYQERSFTGKNGIEARQAEAAHAFSSGLRTDSFSAGKELMVGVIDLTVLRIENLPKPVFAARPMHGGYKLAVQLGRFKATTNTSISGRKWIGHKMHLSWDGRSDLVLSITSSSGLTATASWPLSGLKGTASQELSLVFKSIGKTESDSLTASIQALIRLDFIDLRD